MPGMQRDAHITTTLRAVSAVTLAALILSVAGCRPRDAAVGDTHSDQSSAVSSGVQRDDVLVGVIGLASQTVGRSLTDA